MFVVAIVVPSKAPIYEAAIALIIEGGCAMECPDMETAGAHSLSGNRDVNSLKHVFEKRYLNIAGTQAFLAISRGES